MRTLINRENLNQSGITHQCSRVPQFSLRPNIPEDKNEKVLTKEQNDVVELDSGQHIVLAPPGTGKTELLVQRLTYAIKNGVEQEDMICLTFTNRAAKNMIERVRKDFGEHHIFIGNIHSFCNSFLRKYKLIPQGTSLIDDEDTNLILREIYEEFQKEDKNFGCLVYERRNSERTIKPAELVKYNHYLRVQDLSFPSGLIENPRIYFFCYSNEWNAKKICNRYEEIKRESNFIDFDDLLILTYYHLNKPEYSNDVFYKWLQIDEVQDLNPLQWAIINKLSPKEKSHRVFFGDYEQAIFSFMGAKLEILDNVARECDKHVLACNFRSPQYLLDLYIAYARSWLKPQWQIEPFAENKEKICPNALSLRIAPSHSNVPGFYVTEIDEVRWIVKKKLPRRPKDKTAVLVRTNRTADLFAREFDKRGLNYFKISGFDLFRRKEVKDILSFFRILVNSSDRNAWTRIFCLFANIRTLGESRHFVNQLFKAGLRPLDFIKIPKFKKTYLDDFLSKIRNERIVVFDTETTGLDVESDDIIQIAAVEIVKGELGDTFEVYINTEKDLTESEKIHHISKEYLDKNAIDKKIALKQFLNFGGKDTVVAHNLQYDFEILNNNLHRCNLEKISSEKSRLDSVEIAKRLYPFLPSYKLEFLLKELNVKGQNSHNALDDVKATANLITAFKTQIEKTYRWREDFLNHHLKTLKLFRKRFSPIYQAMEGEFANALPLHEFTSLLISYMHDHGYKFDDNIYNEMEKLTKHMRLNCILGGLRGIEKYIPEYAKYTEADLLLDDEQLIISTIHKAKGLEFVNVVIPGCTEDNFPSYWNRGKKEKIIEDARLLYVAMTRAQKRILITTHNKYERYEKYPSRFLKPVRRFFKVTFGNGLPP